MLEEMEQAGPQVVTELPEHSPILTPGLQKRSPSMCWSWDTLQCS